MSAKILTRSLKKILPKLKSTIKKNNGKNQEIFSTKKKKKENKIIKINMDENSGSELDVEVNIKSSRNLKEFGIIEDPDGKVPRDYNFEILNLDKDRVMKMAERVMDKIAKKKINKGKNNFF